MQLFWDNAICSHGSGQFSRICFTFPFLIRWQWFVSQLAETCAIFQKHDYDTNYEEGQAGRGRPENVQAHCKKLSMLLEITYSVVCN